jgi:hypothetical protein
MESASEEERPIYRQLRSYSQRVFSVFGDKVPVPTVMATVVTKGQVQDVQEQSCDILDMDVRPREEEKPGKVGSHQLSLSKPEGGSRDLPDVQTVADHARSFPGDGRPDEGGNLNTEWVADTLLGDETLIETVDGRGQDNVAFDMTRFIRVHDGQVDISMNGAVCYLVYVSLASLSGSIYLVIGIY